MAPPWNQGEEFYSSREDHPLRGYPSCSRAVARRPRATLDPNNYYEELGLLPWCTDAEVRSALRTKFKRYHPDGHHPDRFMHDYLVEIAHVLGDPQRRAWYDSLPPGQVVLDSHIRRILELSGAELPAVVPPTRLELEEAHTIGRWDYFSVGRDPYDLEKAQRWYLHLVDVAPVFRYTRPIRVLLYDGDFVAWKEFGGVAIIPRTWEPSSANAFAIFAVKITPLVFAMM